MLATDASIVKINQEFRTQAFLTCRLVCLHLSMALVERFEDLRCWQATRELANMVYVLSRQGPLAKDFDLRSQIRRAAVGAMSNIAEGFGRFSDKEFIRFLEMSQSSSQEVKSLTYLIEDQKQLTLEEILTLRNQAEKSKSLTLGLVRYIISRSRGKS
jgi:four helix bundle protein